MRFMLNAFTTQNSDASVPPNPKLAPAIGKLAEELSEAGVLLAMAGLAPTSKGARIKLSGGEVTVTDGPFTETKEVIGGAWIVEVDSKEDAIDLAKRIWRIFAEVYGPSYAGEGEVRELSAWVNFEAPDQSTGQECSG
jgi:hypothetical protein